MRQTLNIESINNMKIQQDPHPALYLVSTTVESADYKTVALRAMRALALLRKTNNGVGLAANQIGDNRRWFVSQVFKVCINPELIESSAETETKEEGCLSKPGYKRMVKRSSVIRVRWINKGGKFVNRQLRGMSARIFLHELDHLDGVNIWPHR